MKIHIRNLSKIYPGDKRALNEINLDISNGLFGLLGPNGAGKTTLMRILVTLMKPTNGTVTIDNLDLQKNRKIDRLGRALDTGASGIATHRVRHGAQKRFRSVKSRGHR